MPVKIVRIFLLAIFLSQVQLIGQMKEIVAYYPAWGAEHQNYLVRNIKTSGSADKITVLIYAFVEPGPDSLGNIVPKLTNPYIDYQQPYSADMSIDGIADESTQALKGQFNQLRKLKSGYPDLKILLSIGGWGGSKYYSDAALTPGSREVFVNDCIKKFIFGKIVSAGVNKEKGIASGIFDGFDIDWEFPISGGPEGIHNNKSDRENLTELLALFREKLNEINPKLILTNAIAADKPNLDNFDVKSGQKYLNWFNLMTYDFHGEWDKVTAHHTNLLSSPNDTTENGAKISLNKTIKYFMDSLGVDGGKLVPGAAFYGKHWSNVGSTNNGLYQPGIDSAGTFEEGIGNYSNFHTLELNGYQYHWDNLAMAPWLYNPEKKIFWTFDDEKSIALKSRYVDAYNLRGIMFWEISEDDSAGTLVNTIYNRNMTDVKIVKTINVKSFQSIEITQPQSTDTFSAGSNIIINTNEIDKEDSIIKVEFFGDDVSIGYDTKAPFDWVWFNVPKGRHKIKAVATGGNGNMKASKEVIINIY